MDLLDRFKNSLCYKWISVFAPVATIITCSLAIIVLIFNYNYSYSEAVVKGYVSKYKYKNIISYSGKLENESNVHADKLNVKGEIDPGRVLDLKVETQDKVEPFEYNKLQIPVTFSLNRLPKKNKCYFNIIVAPTGEIGGETKEMFYVSWGKEGFEKIIPKYVNEDDDAVRSIKRGIDLLSFNQRDKWLKDNTKNISKRRQ